MDLGSSKDRLTGRLPAEWRVIYHWAKNYVLNWQGESASKPASWSEEFSEHRITILTSCLVIAAAMALRTLLPPHVSLAPFFVFGCVFPTLIIGRRWGTMAAVLCTVLLSVTRIYLNPKPFHVDSSLWNVLMRFLFFEFYVLVFDCIRRLARDPSDADEHMQASPPI